jgi:Ubiquitin carboxyl-terminal hydrolase
MSAVLQCLIHCVPLQRFFLHDNGFNFEACELYRNMEITGPLSGASYRIQQQGNDNILIASEMDKLFLRYYSSTTGYDIVPAVHVSLFPKSDHISATPSSYSPAYKGQPLLLNDMLATVWRCRGMRHLAGYDQRDAHEFLHAFLNNMGKGIQMYNDVVRFALNTNDTTSQGKEHSNTGKSYIGPMNPRTQYALLNLLFFGYLEFSNLKKT